MKHLHLSAVFLSSWVALACLTAENSSAFAKSVKGYSGGWTSLFPYEAKEVQALSHLPAPIQTAVNQYLLGRVGRDYLNRMQFERAEIVDFDELYRTNPQAKDYRWKIPAYQISFKIADPSKGIEHYSSVMRVDSAGLILEDIGFPPVALMPNKARFISIEEAESIASGIGIQGDVELSYDKERNSIVYEFVELLSEKGPWLTYRKVVIDAHDGALVQDGQIEGIR